MNWWVVLVVAQTSVFAGQIEVGTQEDCNRVLSWWTQETAYGKGYDGQCVLGEPKWQTPEEYNKEHG